MKIYDEELIISWLKQKVSKYSKVPIEDIETDVHISETYGLSSINAVSMIGELEEYIIANISPSILFEFPTIHELGHHLAVRDGKAYQFQYRIGQFLKTNFSELTT